MAAPRLGLVVLTFLTTIGCISSCSPSARSARENVGHARVEAVESSGRVAVHDEVDLHTQAMLDAQGRREAEIAARSERYERIKAAPKRSAGDPLLVALYETELDEALTSAQHSEGAVFDQLRDEFEDDDAIVLVDPVECDEDAWRAQTQGTSEPPAADIEVLSRAYLKEIAGVDRRTGKPAKAAVLVFEATITSDYLEDQFTVSEEGNLFRNAEVTRDFANKVKFVIKSEIRPMLPADRNI